MDRTIRKGAWEVVHGESNQLLVYYRATEKEIWGKKQMERF